MAAWRSRWCRSSMSPDLPRGKERPQPPSAWWGKDHFPWATVGTDRASGEAERRYRTQRGFAQMVVDAARRAEAYARLEFALRQLPGSDERLAPRG